MQHFLCLADNIDVIPVMRELAKMVDVPKMAGIRYDAIYVASFQIDTLLRLIRHYTCYRDPTEVPTTHTFIPMFY